MEILAAMKIREPDKARKITVKHIESIKTDLLRRLSEPFFSEAFSERKRWPRATIDTLVMNRNQNVTALEG